MDNVTVEKQFENIETLLKELERDDIGIEEALEKYTTAKKLIDETKEKIDMVEKEVLKLLPDGETVPFDEVPF